LKIKGGLKMKKLAKFSLILAIVSLLVSGLYAGVVTKV